MMGLTEGQRRCVQTLDRALVVAAGAGSGKTFTLTERIVHALKTGYVQDIGQVMAITFTRKAAGELKSRIKAALRANGMVDQALKVDGAWISTIHGMCGRILRAHAIELGLDPAFTVAEGPDLDRMMVEAVDGALVAARMERPDETAALFGEYSATGAMRASTSVGGMVKSLVAAACANPAGADAFVIAPSRVKPLLILKHVAATIDEVRDLALLQKETPARTKWLASIDEAYDAIAEALRAGEDDAFAALRLIAPVKFDRRFGSGDYKDAAADAALALRGCAMELRLHLATGLAITLVAIARDAYGRFQQAKHSAGILDNSDLLVMAARALDENPRIAACYADAFKLIMVDEFQDTDQLQVDMVKRLAGPGFERLCTVGDAQQSIYRFRGADVSVYRRHLEAIRRRDPAAVIELHDNFRSHGDVLAFVRCVFERPDMFGGSFMNLEAGREESQVKHPFDGFGPRVSVLHTCAPYRGAVPRAALQVQARRIAEHFAKLHEAGRPASDMVLLLGAMRNAGVYASALREAGLPCVIAGGTVFPSSVEAQAVLDAVRVLADPHDTRALYRLLAGPFFELGSDELVVLATRRDDAGAPRRRSLDAGVFALMQAVGNGDNAGAAGATAGGGVSMRLTCAIRVIGDALRAVGTAPASQLVRRMAIDGGWLARLEEQGPEGLAGAGNLLKALRFLEDEEDAGGMGPAQLARRFESLLDGMKEGPGALSAGAGDFVRIMTVHASKGLEFPVVALADLGGARTASGFLAEDVGGRIYVSLDLGRTGADLGGAAAPSAEDARGAFAAAFDEAVDEDDLARVLADGADAFTQRAALALRNHIGEREERKRLLYVALTRAREALVIAVDGLYSKSNPVGLANMVLADAVRALGYGAEDGAPIMDRAMYDFGGTQPAVVERIALEPGQTADDVLGDGGDAVADGLGSGGGAIVDGLGGSGDADEDGAADAGALVALPTQRPPVQRDPLRLPRSGVFSYSSIAEASHEGDLLDRLAAAYALSPGNESQPPGLKLISQVSGQEPANGDDAFWDDDFWAAPSAFSAGAGDADKATDLGTAFHRLAQYAVDARGADGVLAMPPDERVQALSHTCGLGPEARRRLDAALERWFASEAAARAASHADLAAEVPFYVRIQSGEQTAGEVHLEGEIDLLAFSDDGRHAWVFDYKTGGSPDEGPEELACKHVLQASCYAYALLRAGVEQVEAAFVRVEQPDPDDADQPQIVRYRFAAADRADLESAIVAAYAMR